VVSGLLFHRTRKRDSSPTLPENAVGNGGITVAWGEIGCGNIPHVRLVIQKRTSSLGNGKRDLTSLRAKEHENGEKGPVARK